jgi:hypothetical protein
VAGSKEAAEVVAKASMVWAWSARILTMRGESGMGAGSDMVRVRWRITTQHSVTGRQGAESESRELAVGQGRELGWAGLARLDKDRRLG